MRAVSGRRGRARWWWQPGLLVALALGTAGASAQDAFDPNERGASPGGAGDAARDNTRVMGTVYDVEGQPLSRVEVWVTNDRAPANRVRSRSRETGSYLVRGMAELYDERDLEGILLRIRFEAAGYQAAEFRVAVARNGVERLDPVLLAEGAQPPGSRPVLVSGAVTDSRGKGVRGLTVDATGADGAALGSATTDRGGRYELLLWTAPAELVVRCGRTESKVAVRTDLPPGMVIPQVVDLRVIQ